MSSLAYKLNSAIADIEKWRGQAFQEGDEVALALEQIKNVSEELADPHSKIYCGWTIGDVEHVLNNLKADGKYGDVEFTDEFGKEVMDLVDRRMDAEYGVCWESIEYAIEEILKNR